LFILKTTDYHAVSVHVEDEDDIPLIALPRQDAASITSSDSTDSATSDKEEVKKVSKNSKNFS